MTAKTVANFFMLKPPWLFPGCAPGVCFARSTARAGSEYDAMRPPMLGRFGRGVKRRLRARHGPRVRRSRIGRSAAVGLGCCGRPAEAVREPDQDDVIREGRVPGGAGVGIRP